MVGVEYRKVRQVNVRVVAESGLVVFTVKYGASMFYGLEDDKLATPSSHPGATRLSPNWTTRLEDGNTKIASPRLALKNRRC